jgi:sigma-E factor negative regulatory protein RseA
MTERISALMDGECDERELSAGLESLHAPGEALESWRTYHLIRDAMSDTRLTSSGFAARVTAQLEREPTVLAPRAMPPAPKGERERGRWTPLYAAAGIAAAALVGSVVLAPQPATEAPVLAVAPAKPAPAAVAVPAAHQLTNAENDYLLAHQAYSPRNGFQGVAPYVRTVAERGPARTR